MSAAIRVQRADQIPPRPAPPPLRDARVASALSRQQSASVRLQHATAELDNRRKALTEAQQARRESLATGRAFGVDLDALSRAVSEQEALVSDIAFMVEDADRRLAAARKAALSDEDVRAVEAEIEAAVEGYARWIREGAELHGALEALRVRASGRLGHPSGLEVELKMSVGHATKAHEILKQTVSSSAFARGAWRSHV